MTQLSTPLHAPEGAGGRVGGTATGLQPNSAAIALLGAFRPIGAAGNNRLRPWFDPVPGSAQLCFAPMRFKAGSKNSLADGPNPRTVSNAIAGGSGAGGDVGIATLACTRHALGLPRLRSFADPCADRALRRAFQDIYGSIDQVDLFMGGLAEAPADGAVVGPTFQAIIARQFRNLRDGDRFYWRNQGFDRATAAMIASTKLSHILRRNTDSTSVPEDVFVAAERMPARARHDPRRVIDTHGFERPAEMR